MKKIIKGLSLVLALSTVGFMNGQHKNHKNVSVTPEESTEFIPAIRLINNPDGSCTFEKGKIPTLKHMNTTTFWMSNKTEEWEKNAHPAPRRQYVITIKGNIRFKVTDGSTFMIKPGVVLLAEDLKGTGHSWDMVKSKEWERLYIPISENADDFFVRDAQ
jgi:quercetin dioxygenase-like cupin family protein